MIEIILSAVTLACASCAVVFWWKHRKLVEKMKPIYSAYLKGMTPEGEALLDNMRKSIEKYKAVAQVLADNGFTMSPKDLAKDLAEQRAHFVTLNARIKELTPEDETED